MFLLSCCYLVNSPSRATARRSARIVWVRRLLLRKHNAQDILLREDEIVFVFDLQLVAGVLGKEHLIARLDAHRDEPAVVVSPSGTDADHLALHRPLFGGCVGEVHPTTSPFFFRLGLDEGSIGQWSYGSHR